jgi:membrane protein CcdC involved in cytochrome C biogenesis
MARIRYVVALLVTLFALLTLADRFVLLEIFVRRLGLPILLAAAEAFAIAATGMLLRRRASDPPLDFLIGYPLFGAICFLVGLVKVAMWTMLPVVAIGVVAWGVVKVRSSNFEVRNEETSNLEPRTSNFIAIASIAIILFAGFVIAQAPAVSLDEVTYHLAVPRAWALEGRAVDLPLLSHSYFPLGIESADLPLLATLGTDGAIGGAADRAADLVVAGDGGDRDDTGAGGDGRLVARRVAARRDLRRAGGGARTR